MGSGPMPTSLPSPPPRPPAEAARPAPAWRRRAAWAAGAAMLALAASVKQLEARVEAAKQDVEVKRNAADNERSQAELDVALTALELERYQKGDYPVACKDHSAQVTLSEAALVKAEDLQRKMQE